MESGYIKNFFSECNKAFKKFEVLIYELKGEPTYDYLDECAEKMRKYQRFRCYCWNRWRQCNRYGQRHSRVNDK